MGEDDDQNVEIFINKINAETYGYIEDATTYKESVGKLNGTYNKKPNIVYAR